MIKLSDYVMKFITQQGVKDLFVLSGGGCMHLLDSLGRNSDINYICCLFEQVASFAASAYSQYTSNIGVALVTTGPGGTNALTGVAAAWTDSIPLLMISGQVKRSDMAGESGIRMLGFQEIDIVSIVKPITKYAVTVLDPDKIKYHLQKAVFLAISGRPGPVWIDIPLDVQATLIDEEKLKPFKKEELNLSEHYGAEKDLPRKVAQLIKMIECAQRPVLLAGYGIRISKYKDKFNELIQRLNVPVLTTWKALDLMPENHELYFGRPGCIGQRGANFIQQNSDLFISIGARLDFGQIGYSHNTFAREATKVIVDVDAAELNKFNFKVDLSINTTADQFIDEFLKQTKLGRLNLTDKWFYKCKEWKDKFPVVLPEHWEKKGYASTYALVDSLSQKSQSSDLYVPENSGAASEVIMQALRLKNEQRVITTNSLGAMGSGLPASIGACIASGLKNTICVIGDGGMMMNIQDLETVARLELPIKYFILNNDGYGSIKTMQSNYFEGFYVASEPSSGVTLPNYEKVSASYGIDYKRINNNSDIEKMVGEILDCINPVICEVMVDPYEKTMPKLASYVKPDGTMVSKPLEDLWPFLDREEFLSNMIVDPVEE